MKNYCSGGEHGHHCQTAACWLGINVTHDVMTSCQLEIRHFANGLGYGMRCCIPVGCVMHTKVAGPTQDFQKEAFSWILEVTAHNLSNGNDMTYNVKL